MLFTQGQISDILGCSAATESKYFEHINATCEKYSINTILRLAAFIAQVGHESGRLQYVQENLNYSSSGLLKTFPKYFDSTSANECAKQPEKIANRVYCNRYGNGSESSGDGYKYSGKGLIQVTFKGNYSACAKGIGVDCVSNPEVLKEPQYACLSAGWFWNSKGLNDYADRKDLTSTTRIINGGSNGAADREAIYQRALYVLSGGKDGKDIPPATTEAMSSKNNPSHSKRVGEPRSTAAPVYPFNQVTQSRSGHLIEIDDTPGAERLNFQHRTGSYLEMDPLGNVIEKSVLNTSKITKEDSSEWVGVDFTKWVGGKGYYKFGGNASFSSAADVFIEAGGRVQVNAPVLSASTKIVTPFAQIDELDVGQIKGDYADILSREATVAWDIGRLGGGGYAPIINSSMTFDGPAFKDLNANLASNKVPQVRSNGSPIISNGVDPVAVAAAAEIATKQAAIAAKNVDPTEAKVPDAAPTVVDAGNPIFVKHVSMDKPFLPSRSLAADAPDPKLYTNNLHVIVNDEGVGQLHISDSVTWVPIASDFSSQLGLELGIVNDRITETVSTLSANIMSETQARSDALVAETVARNDALATEAESRQGVNLALLAEVQNRNDALVAEAQARIQAIGVLTTAITSEQTSRSSADSALSQRIDTIVAVAGGSTAAIDLETTARVDGDNALSLRVDTLVSKTDDIEALIVSEVSTLTTADTALGHRIDTMIATVDTNLALLTNEQTVRASGDSANAASIVALAARTSAAESAIISEQSARATSDGALTTSLNTLSATANGKTRTYRQATSPVASAIGDIWYNSTNNNAVSRWDGNSWVPTDDTRIASTAAAVTTEQTARATADTALGQRIDTVVANTAANTASITSEITARTTADSALSTRIDSVLSTTNNNTAAITTESNARTTADSALSTRIDSVLSKTDTNTAAITSEQTARTNADSANSTRIDSVSAVANAKNKTFYQGTAPTAEAVGDLWIDTSNNNVAKRWNGGSWVDTSDKRIEANIAAITTEQTARAAADLTLSNRIDVVTAATSGFAASITSEQNARISGDDALAQNITTLSSGSMNGFDAAATWNFDVDEEGWTSTGAAQAIVSGALEVTSSTSNPYSSSPALLFSGATYNLLKIRVKRLAGSGWDGTVFYSTAGHAMSGIYCKTVPNPMLPVGAWRVLEWDMSAIADWNANDITQLRLDLGASASDKFQIDWVSIGRIAPGASHADIVSLQQTLSSGDALLATNITSLSTTVDSHTASITEQQTSISGIGAQYGIKIDNNGHIAGIGLLSTSAGNNVVSEFNIIADKFRLIKPTVDGEGEALMPFEIDTTTVPATIRMHGQIELNGSGGTFSGDLNAASGSFSGDISGSTGTFGGTLKAGVIDFSKMAGVSYEFSNPGAYTITVPAGKTTMRVGLYGGGAGGGGGGGGTSIHGGNGGGGGGAGQYLVATLSNLVAGTNYTLYVGAGGAGGYGGWWLGGYGGNGGATYIAGLVSSAGGTAGGGGGNVYYQNVLGVGGASPRYVGSNGTIGGNYSSTGSEGDRVTISARAGIGGVGGGGGKGAGGRGGNGIVGPGSGAAGYPGTAGNNGYALIEFFDPNTVVLKQEYNTLLAALQRQSIAIT